VLCQTGGVGATKLDRKPFHPEEVEEVEVEEEVEAEVAGAVTMEGTTPAVTEITRKEGAKVTKDGKTIRDLSAMRRRQMRISDKTRQRNDISHCSFALYLFPLM
jgi:hypothetical protein